MEKKILKKILVMAIVFVIVFSNCGVTLQALASSEGLSIFGLQLFGKNMLKYKAYFVDNDGNEVEETKADINGDLMLVLELEPKETGYLKSGTVKAVADEGDPNFEFSEILYVAEGEEEEKETLEQVVQLDQQLLKTEQFTELEKLELETTKPVENILNAEKVEQENTVTNEVEGNKTTSNEVTNNAVTNTDANTVTNTVTNTTNTTSNNEVANTITNEVSNATTNETVNETAEATTTTEEAPTEAEEGEELVDETEAYEEEVAEKTSDSTMLTLAASATVLSPDEVQIDNVVGKAKVYVKVKYKAGETVNVADLYKSANLEFSGTFIDENLEEVSVQDSGKVTVEWTYTKDVLVSTQITKVSPFEVEGTKGTIVESTINILRDCTEENYLPIKETVIEVKAPEINGKLPSTLDVSSSKLKATSGEEINEVTFSNENWKYDAENNTITIKVENPNCNLTSGEDIYKIIYRYDEYVESEEITLNTKGTVTIEEYSGKENNIITKEISGSKTAIVNIGELITYSIGTTDQNINKAKINANYNSVESVYEEIYTSTVAINILTNDVLREFRLKDTKEYYVDKSNIEFEATEVKYKSIAFKYNEINEMLLKGGSIEIKANTGELLYTLTSELIHSEEDCKIELNGDIRGVEILVKNISVNGTITVDFEKVIGKCSYDKSAFINFEKLQSRIKAEVIYSESQEVIELPTIQAEKYFDKSYSRAELFMNTEELSTLKDNENVELKIELNNDKEDSDLWINPQFEIVFPSYVTNVEVKAINLLYEEGLAVKNITLFRDSNNIQRMNVELEGVQRNFSLSEITNGTNIIINTKIAVDDYTPKKVDQLKMYYFNQGATNYQAQTDWKMSSGIPEGILKTTNGFDVEVFSFGAPTGFITANGIENYDGLGSTVETIKQGEVTAKAEMGQVARPMVMTLAALNNTGNDCTDVVMLGRVPAKDATDVVTGKKMGNNINTQMISGIEQNPNNPIGCDIYYSTNPNANKNISDGSNFWKKTPDNFSEVKSFLIVPTSEVKAGVALKFTYNFQVPANLPYDVVTYGNFGAFYNNLTDVAVVYETSSADLVGVITDSGPKVEASLSVDIGDGADILSEKRMKYTVTVVNSGSIDIQNINVKAPIPEYTTYTVKDGRCYMGDHSYVVDNTKKEMEFNIPILTAGETKSFDYYVRTNRKPYLDSYATGKDEKGYYIEEVVGYKEVEVPSVPSEPEENTQYENGEKVTTQEPIIEKKYITEVPNIYITNKATITTETLANTIETNETKNELKYANFNTNITLDYDRVISPGTPTNFTLNVQNISDRDLKNVEAIFNVGSVYEFSSGKINGEPGEITFNAEEGKIYFKIPEMKKGEITVITTEVVGKKIDKPREEYNCQFQLKADDMTNYEYSTPVNQSITRGMIDAKDSTLNTVSQIKENETIVISTLITNIGLSNVTTGKFKCDVPNNMDVRSIKSSDGSSLSTGNGTGKVDADLPIIKENESITVDMTLKAKNMSGVDSQKVILNRKITADNQEDINIDAFEFTVLNSEKTEEEIEKEREEEANKKYEEEQKKKEEEEKKEEYDDSISNSSGGSKPTTPETPVAETPAPEPEPTPQPENTNQENTNENNIAETPVEEKYSINGIAWLDANRNGVRDDGEEILKNLQVYLLTSDGKITKTTSTNVSGMYTFTDVSKGKYIVGFVYETKDYMVTTYKKSGVQDDRNSDAVETKSGDLSAISNEIVVEGNINNIDLGLQKRDVFDLAINKYISKITVTTKKGTQTYDYNNKDLAKIDIHSKQVNGAKVTLEYKIILENKGSLEGNAEQVIDYLSPDLSFVESENSDWYKGTDGYIYIKNLNLVTLIPGQSKEYKLKVTKTMTGENTGVLANKAELLSSFNSAGILDNKENNSSVQNTIITISTGRTTQTVIIFIFIIAVLAGLGYKNMLPIDLSNISFNKVYKAKDKDKKIKMKKFYK